MFCVDDTKIIVQCKNIHKLLFKILQSCFNVEYNLTHYENKIKKLPKDQKILIDVIILMIQPKNP